MEKEELLANISQLIESRSFKTLRDILSDMNPPDLGELIGELSPHQIPLVFRILPKDLAGDVFSYMETETQELLIKSFSDVELKEIINDLWLDDTVDIIEEMPANVVARILRAAPASVRCQINELLKYPEDSAGSVMTVEYVSLAENLTVEECFQKIRREGINKETVYTCYVTDRRKLVGTVSVKDLLLADSDELVSEIMETNVLSVDAYEDKELVAQMFSKYDILALPVVDKDQRIVGIVTVDDAMDVMEDEATEDIDGCIAAIREAGAKVGISIKPKTEASVLKDILAKVDLVLVMSVEPGFGGQSFIDGSLDKIRELAAMRQELGAKFLIEVDGGISSKNAGEVFAAGAEALVAGSAVFGAADPEAEIVKMLEA